MIVPILSSGEKVIAEAIRAAHETGSTVAVVSGNYEIAETVLLPSDTTLVLRDCWLRMKDGVMCQMFRNEHAETAGVTDRGIHLRGEGRAILDGGEYNGLSESTSEEDGRPHIIQNNLLLFVDVDGFSVSGIQARNQRWWALNFIACRNGHLHDIDFCSDFTRIDSETGERVAGLRHDCYGGVYVKNSDGIDLRLGCHDILIENITGFTEDDTVALTALEGSTERQYPFPEDAEHGIHNIIIRNVRSSAYCANIRLLNQGGTMLYNVLIDGVFDTSKEDPRMDRGGNGVRVGDDHLYGPRHSTEEETFNITVKNVCSRAFTALNLRGKIGNLHYENIAGFDGCGCVIDDKTQTNT